jgi:hypothetical protein
MARTLEQRRFKRQRTGDLPEKAAERHTPKEGVIGTMLRIGGVEREAASRSDRRDAASGTARARLSAQASLARIARSACSRTRSTPGRAESPDPIQLETVVTNVGFSRPVTACDPRRSVGETPRNAMPFAFDISRPISDEQTKRRVATNQALLRHLNEAMRSDRGDEEVAFRCECGQLGCNQLIGLTRAEYDAVRAHPRRFAIVPAHEIVEIETIVERHERYAVVKAHDPAAAAVADRTSPPQQPSN